MPWIKPKPEYLPSVRRQVPNVPPKGPMRHLSGKEIGACDLLAPRITTKDVCLEEMNRVKKCWKENGAGSIEYGIPQEHPCYEIEHQFKVCLYRERMRGTKIHRYIGNEQLHDFMWKFMYPLREYPQNYLSQAKKLHNYSKRDTQRHYMWYAGKPKKRRKY